MKFNVGIADRVIRMLIGAAGFYVGYTRNYLWSILGGALILTAVIGICPIYSLFGLKTIGKHKDHSEKAPRDF